MNKKAESVDIDPPPGPLQCLGEKVNSFWREFLFIQHFVHSRREGCDCIWPAHTTNQCLQVTGRRCHSSQRGTPSIGPLPWCGFLVGVRRYRRTDIEKGVGVCPKNGAVPTIPAH